MSLTVRHLHALQRGITTEKAAILVTVIAVKGSAPRGAGTVMIVFEDALEGTIGGGRLEFEAIQQAHRMMSLNEAAIVRERYPLGDRLGQCCGGSVELLYEPVKRVWKAWVNDAIAALKIRKEYIRSSSEGYSHIVKPPEAYLVLFGAGHVGRALVQVLKNAPIEVHWVDEREKEFPENVPVNVSREVTDLPEVVVENAPVGSAVLITTHRHDLDFTLAELAIARSDLAYCGMIGSTSKRGRFERQWRQRGRGDAMLQNLICPIGASGPSGKEPEVVAIAVAAEILSALSTARQQSL